MPPSENQPSIHSVCVVGGGAAGLMAAISAATHGAGQVTLLEGTKRLGTKILMSGGTRCNVTHDVVVPGDYFGGSRNVVARLLREFSHLDSARFFEQDLGVRLKREDTGKLFPVSDDAQEVVDALVRLSRERGVAILPGHRVTAIARVGTAYELTTSAGVVRAHRVILTTGGLSFPRTGSDGTGYALAQSLGHAIVRTSPALTPLVARSGGMHERLRGVTVPAALTVLVGEHGNRFWQGTGSFLFTHFGYSGPVALDASRHVVREGWNGPVRVVASFAPGLDADAADRALLDEAAAEPRRTVLGFLRGHVPESLAAELAAAAGVEGEQPLSRLSRDARRAIAQTLTARDLDVLEVMGYRKAEVTAGGVPLEEVDPSTLESRRSPGLHFAGEILHVDGRLGGYNFQWAWSTGWVAGKGAARLEL